MREDILPPEEETEVETKSATYSRLVEDEDEFVYIRESNSAPLDSPVRKGMSQCSKIRKKVQFQKYKNTFFAISKNGKKISFAQEKNLKLPKMQFSDFFLLQKLIFYHF